MRVALLVVATLGLVVAGGIRPDSPLPQLVAAVSAQAPPTVPPGEPIPPGPSPLAIEAEEARGTGWGATAVWITIGMVALVLLALAVVLSIRGGGRTVLKE